LEEFKTLFKPEIFILALVGIIALHCIYLHWGEIFEGVNSFFFNKKLFIQGETPHGVDIKKINFIKIGLQFEIKK
jgi:hypothetical protein